MTILSAEDRAVLIRLLEAKVGSADPPLRDMLSLLLVLLYDCESLAATARNKEQTTTNLIAELRKVFDDDDTRLQ